MRRFLRLSLAGLLAFALIASGATWRQCFAAPAPAATAQSAPDHAAHASHHEHAAQHEHAAGHEHTAAAVDDSKAPIDDHACLKCCSMCAAATVAPAATEQVVVLAASSLVFSVIPDALSGQTVRIDPGIPKHPV